MSKKEINNKKLADIVIAIDPGREKCGMAVVRRPNSVLHKAIVSTEDLITEAAVLQRQYGARTVILGNGTSSRDQYKRLEESGAAWNIISVDEYRTTDMARMRYWQENPPHGWRRFIPVTMQVAPVPVDDYVAVILAEKYFMTNG